MKKLLLACCLALASYGCEKVEPELKVLKFVFDDNGDAFSSSVTAAQRLMNDVFLENFKSINKSDPHNNLEKTEELFTQIQRRLYSLSLHNKYWQNASKSGCNETANYAYDNYMGFLKRHLNAPDGLNFKKKLEQYLKRIKDYSPKTDPSIRAIIKNNINLLLEYEKKLEENYNANLQAN